MLIEALQKNEVPVITSRFRPPGGGEANMIAHVLAQNGRVDRSTNPSGARARARTGTGWGEGVATKQSVLLGEAEARREKVERE